jgi:succinyl-CoA synthetase beta subunit
MGTLVVLTLLILLELHDMNLHEYQAKSLLRQYCVPVPEGIAADSEIGAVDAAKLVREKTGIEVWAIKAQIHAGGRGKAGGIKIAGSLDEVSHLTHDMLGKQLVTHQTGKEGKLVRKVLVEQSIYYPGESEVKEYYLSIMLNRNKSRYTFIYSKEGGVEIEKVAENTPDLIEKEEIDPKVGLRVFQARKIAFNLGLGGKLLNETVKFLSNLYYAFEKTDASLIEINPLVKTSDNKLFAADAKIIIDDNALFRHPDLAEMRDVNEEDPSEVEAGYYGLNFVKLNGNVGCMVNGAGLAMATMDIIKLSGGEPANFLDVGGNATAKTVEAGFRIILKDPNVRAVLINIFGGIVRCDRVAQGIVDAYNNIGTINVPVIVRLQGTNAIEGKALIDNSGLKVFSVISLQEAATMVNNVVR